MTEKKLNMAKPCCDKFLKGTEEINDYIKRDYVPTGDQPEDTFRLEVVGGIERNKHFLTSPKGREDLAGMMMDAQLVAAARSAMESKINRSREKGRSGWWDANQCSLEQLRNYLHEHIAKGDMVDVMNIAAMIWVREAMGDPQYEAGE